MTRQKVFVRSVLFLVIIFITTGTPFAYTNQAAPQEKSAESSKAESPDDDDDSENDDEGEENADDDFNGDTVEDDPFEDFDVF
jgi:hypothetical protein